MTKLVILFIALNIVNVIIQTAKSLVTIKGNKVNAALINAITYALYTYVIFYTALEGIALWQKALIVGMCNLVGVFVVKWAEEKLSKDKIWIFQCTAKVENEEIKNISHLLKEMGISLTYNQIKENLYTMSIYSYNQKESTMIKSILENYRIKFCVIQTMNEG